MEVYKMKKINLGFGAFILLISLSAIVSAQSYQGCGMMSGFYGGYGTGFMFLSWITFILFIALLIAGIYWLIKSANRKR
jgi:hypothetical protein